MIVLLDKHYFNYKGLTFAKTGSNARLGAVMPNALTPAILSTQCPTQSAVAAAVTLIANRPTPVLQSDLVKRALRAVAPHLPDDQCETWINALTEPLRKAGVITSRCLAAFLGQCAVESGGLQSLEENLNYSATRLCQVWPSRFPDAEAAAVCALQPELLANRVYANRMGNGDEASGDGWRFRGRGLIQLSGRSSYTRFAQAMNMPLDEAVEHAATTAGAADSAVWYWSINQLNALANTWSIDAITRKINGGTNGAAERTRLCQAALKAIGA